MAVEHIVILMLENRSFDEYFGTFPGANGFYNTPQSVFANAWVSLPGNGWVGPAVLPYRLSTFSSQQGHTPECNHGTGPEQTFFFGDGNANDPHMNGWASGYPDLNIPWSDGREAPGTTAGNPVSCMSYYAANDIPYHWWLAQNFALCDNYFCSHMGATEANRVYMISGTIGQDINFIPNPFADLTPTDNPTSDFYGGYPTSSSEAYPPSSWNLNLCPSWPSYADLLTQAAVQAYAQDPNNVPSKYSWRVYDQPLSDTPPDAAGPIGASILNPLFYWANWPDYVGATTPSAQYPQAPYYASFDTFASDAAGNLPAVCWIIPNGGFWEHPTAPPWNGPILISRVLEALLTPPAPNWETTVLIVTYDESDGHYDHVPPPRPSYSTDPDEFITGTFTTFENFSPPNTTVNQQPIGAGFRVPTLVISPWTLNRGVCSDQYDHTSIIRFLEDVTGVHCPNLTNWRRNTFNSLSSINFSGMPVPASSVPRRPDALAIAKNAGIGRYNAAPNKVDDGTASQWQPNLTASSYVPPMPQHWPPVAQGCQVIMTTPSYSLSQVQDQAEINNTVNMATFQSAFIVTVDGFEPIELWTPYAIGHLDNVPSGYPLSASCNTRVPQISITDESGATVQNLSWQCTQIDLDPNSSDPAVATFTGMPRRFTFTYSLTFEDITDNFSFGANTVKTLTVNASFCVDIKVTSSAELELVTAQDPQFYHDFYNDTSWLSGELRVFSIAAGASLFGVTLGDPSNPTAATGTDALNFITGVINALNANQPPTNTPLPPTEFPPNSGNIVQYFDDLNQDENTNPLSLFQTPPNTVPIFNFALARVHMQSDAPAYNVRVFFRSFRMSATDSVYVPTSALTDLSPFRANPPSLNNPGAGDTRIPLLGIANVTVFPGQTGLEYVTIPFFATVRIQFDPKNAGNLTMLDQQDTPNVVPTVLGSPGSPPTETFFGCWLDINQNQNLFPVYVPTNTSDWDSVGPNTPGAESILAAFTRDTHQCLVAEISFDPINIPPGDTPTSSAWLAQRNLGFTEQ